MRKRDGIVKIPFSDLPPEICAKYGYDQQKAAQFDAAVKAAAVERARTAPTANRSCTSGTLSEENRPFDKELTEPEKFYAFSAIGHPKPRDQFETQQDYEARLPKTPDSNHTYYFAVDYESNFSYDITTQQLTIFGGAFKTPEYHSYDLRGTVPLVFHRKIENKGEHEASNAYGKTVTVRKIYFHDFLFHFSPMSLPQGLTAKNDREHVHAEQLALTFHINKDDGKESAPHLVLVCGVKLVDPKRTVDECTFRSKPTIDEPTDLAGFSNGIDADLVSLHVFDARKKIELARFGAP